CKSTIDANSQLSRSEKNDLKDVCDKAASGDADAVRKAARNVCVKIVKDTVPSGAAQTQAVSLCKSSTSKSKSGSGSPSAAGAAPSLGSGTAASSAAVKAAVASCKQTVDSNAQLS